MSYSFIPCNKISTLRRLVASFFADISLFFLKFKAYLRFLAKILIGVPTKSKFCLN